jgi:FkbM family methyltransferase
VKDDLVFDVGANNGDDTAHYLSRGYRVVAVEANPALAARCRDRFGAEIKSGRVVVEEVGIWPSRETRTFYVNDANDHHSSFFDESGQRSGEWHPVQVECLPFRDLLEKHGVPYYLKVDIESADQWCLRDLTADDKPAYVSVEAHRGWYLALLFAVGYNAFKCVNQQTHNKPYAPAGNETLRGRLTTRSRRLRRRVRSRLALRAPQFPRGSSGPFAEETPGDWRNFEATMYDYLHYRLGQEKHGTLDFASWYDFHATYKPEFDRF